MQRWNLFLKSCRNFGPISTIFTLQMQTCFIQLGSNLGNKERNLQNARDLIISTIGTITMRSSLYLSESWGFETADIFLNQVIKVNTFESPENVLTKLLELETVIGRKRNGNGGYASRLIDLDMLFYADRVISENGLVVPHPLLHKRRFVLTPINEIAPDLVHPVFHKTISELLLNCDDRLKVKLYKPKQPNSLTWASLK